MNFIEMALLDTGFSGWIILPSKMKNQINPQMIENPIPYLYSPRFISFKEKDHHKGIINASESYRSIRIRIRTESIGQPIHYMEFLPDMVSFSDKAYAIIGSLFFTKFSLQLTVNYQKRFFSLEQL